MSASVDLSIPVRSTRPVSTQSFVLRDSDQDGKLSRCQSPDLHFRVEDVARALPCPVQQVNGGAIEAICVVTFH